MNGGKIIGNECTAVAVANGATFTMKDGEISDNISNNPGAGVLSRWGIINIQGGSISNNQALVRVSKNANYGAGGGIAEITNGSSSDVSSANTGITLSGQVDISGNQDPEGNDDDIVIVSLQTGMDPVKFKGYAITIGENFSAQNPIALSIWGKNASSGLAVIHKTAPDDCIQYFRYVTDAYTICRNSGDDIVLMKVNLAPINPHWEITERGVVKATWEKAESFKDYSLQLYKDGNPVGEPLTSSSTSKSITIQEPGTYFFKVKTLGSSIYAESPEVTSSNLYTVSFAAEGGTPAPDMQFVVAGHTVMEPTTIAREGYEFGGWYTDSSLTTKWDFSNNTVTEPMTLYALWNAIKYDLWVNGVQVTSLNQDDVLGDADEGATVTYDPMTNTLTLHDATIVVDGTTTGIMANGDLIINVEGENDIHNAEGNYQSLCFATGNLTIQGQGSLTMQTDRVCVHATGLLTIDGVSISAIAHPEDDMWGWAFESNTGIIVQNGANVYTNAGVFGFSAQNDTNDAYITISGSQVTAEPQTGAASLFAEGPITIDKNASVNVSWLDGQSDITIDSSWVQYKGITQPPQVANSVVFEGDTGTVSGNAVLFDSREIAQGKTLTIPEGAALTVSQEKTLSNKGTILNYGTIVGTVENIDEGKLLVPADGITLNKNSLKLYVNTSSSETLIATVSPVNAIEKSVTWSSADEDIATVDAAGNVSAVGTGKTIITAATKDGRFSATCEVVVSRRSSGSLSPITYPVTVPDEVENGDVAVSPQNAESDSDVTIAVKPDTGYVLDELTVTDSDGNEIKLTKKDDSTYRFSMPAGKVTVVASFIEASDNQEENCPAESFTDVDTSQWYHEALDYVIQNGLMNGISDTSFAPHNTTTRGMVVTILWRLENQPVVNYLMTYDDVLQDAYYAEAVRWATAEEIVKGYDTETFGPENLITREQIAAILYRYAQYKGYDVTDKADLSQFSDATKISSYAVEAIAWANANALVNGKGNDILDPLGYAQRCEVAAMLQRLSELVAE